MIKAQLTDPVWCSFAEVGKDNMADLMASRILYVMPETST